MFSWKRAVFFKGALGFASDIAIHITKGTWSGSLVDLFQDNLSPDLVRRHGPVLYQPHTASIHLVFPALSLLFSVVV